MLPIQDNFLMLDTYPDGHLPLADGCVYAFASEYITIEDTVRYSHSIRWDSICDTNVLWVSWKVMASLWCSDVAYFKRETQDSLVMWVWLVGSFCIWVGCYQHTILSIWFTWLRMSWIGIRCQKCCQWRLQWTTWNRNYILLALNGAMKDILCQDDSRVCMPFTDAIIMLHFM